jgi:hypothetical protein
MMDLSDVSAVVSQIQSDSRILFVWHGQQVPDGFQETVAKLQKLTKNLSIEHVERLQLAAYSNSTFDWILSNLLKSESNGDKHSSSDRLYNYLKLLKPKGILALIDTNENIESELKMNGYTNVTRLQTADKSIFVQAEKPNFEVGSVKKLSFASKQKNIEPVKTVWQLNDDDIGEDDLIDTDTLLDENDLKKPDLTKIDCGTTDVNSGKRKACKNCSCGLAQELENEVVVNKSNTQLPAKSACGSCYLGYYSYLCIFVYQTAVNFQMLNLGDAFRCASCPYLGMPAFKPGEKIQLSDRQLKADN